MPRAIIALVCVVSICAIGCGKPAPEPNLQAARSQLSAPLEPTVSQPTPSAVVEPLVAPPEKLSALHLPNAYRITPQVISGGLPEGDAAFQELQDLGVKTVISVDGMEPDVELAHQHGLRYVHLPHGYDQVPLQCGHELAKAVRDLPGPVYIHCHHGKHRSPAAAAVACIEAGLIAPESAERILTAAGTSSEYRGLYASARAARPQDPAFLDALAVEFTATARIPPLADAMVALEHTHDHLRQIAESQWTAPPGHPDLDPAHEALLLKEHFKELLRMQDVATKPDPFRESLRASETAAQELQDALRIQPANRAAAKTAFDAVTANCKSCHRAFRDNPAQ